MNLEPETQVEAQRKGRRASRALTNRLFYFISFAGSEKQVRLEAMLPGVQIPIAASGGVKLGMVAALDNPSAFDHQDLIGTADGREPVRDHERGPALH